MNLPTTPKTLDFLNNLFDTNLEFSDIHDAKFFEKFKSTQNPYLTILKCSDSRVQMESFDKTPQNGVFAIRNIGNQVLTSEGSVDFGVLVLKTPFLLVAGHSGCEAVRCAMTSTKTNIESIDRELATIKLKSDSIGEAIVENINFQVLKSLAKYKDKVASGDLTIFGAIYDFKNDFGFGHGKVVLTSINGEKNPENVKKNYQSLVKNMHFLNL
jgi:carbonic anhydrase